MEVGWEGRLGGEKCGGGVGGEARWGVVWRWGGRGG
jgi:hypothetical protein